jgi:ABC-type transport system substrate-binding protein
VENVLRYAHRTAEVIFDGARVADIFNFELFQNVYEGLVTTDNNSQVIPALAERYDVSDGGDTYTFHLRSGAKFHAPYAREVMASDVKYSLERALWPETQSPTATDYLGSIHGAGDVISGNTKELAGVRVIDEKTLSITLDKACAYFPGMLTTAVGWVVCREAIEANREKLDEKAAIGTGPFRLEAYEPGARIRLAATADYYGGRPYLDGIERPIVLEQPREREMYEKGDLDISLITAGEYVDIQNDPTLRPESHLYFRADLVYLVMHPGLQAEFADQRVRLAFAHAIDRDLLVSRAGRGTWRRADGILPPDVPGYNQHNKGTPYDPDLARQLLAAAGFPGGDNFPQLTLVHWGDPPLVEVAQIIRSSLSRNLGINVELEIQEPSLYYSNKVNERLTFYLAGWIADYVDPQKFLSTLFRSDAEHNLVGYSSPGFDSLCDCADALPDLNERIPLYQWAEQIAIEEVAVLPLFQGNFQLLIKSYVRDLSYNLINLQPHKRTRIQPYLLGRRTRRAHT